MVDESRLVADLLETERKRAAAHLSLDFDMLECILSDQYRQIQSDAIVIGKNELLASYSSDYHKWEIAESDEYKVRMLGNFALLTGRWRGVGENNGEEFNYSARFLAVYKLEEGEWKLISDVSIPLKV
jgi:hypothetical protein